MYLFARFHRDTIALQYEHHITIDGLSNEDYETVKQYLGSHSKIWDKLTGFTMDATAKKRNEKVVEVIVEFCKNKCTPEQDAIDKLFVGHINAMTFKESPKSFAAVLHDGMSQTVSFLLVLVFLYVLLFVCVLQASNNAIFFTIEFHFFLHV